MKQYLSRLSGCPLFAGIAESDIAALLPCLGARLSTHARHTFILREGDSTSAAGLLLQGEALVIQEDFWGNRNLMTRLSPGHLFAEVFACVPGSVLNVSVQADTHCDVLWLDARRLIATCPTSCRHHLQLARNLIAVLADKNLRLNARLTHMGQRTTRDKLLSYLSAESKRHGSAEFDIPFNRQELADFLSVERSAMSTALGRLREEGFILFEKNHFILK